MVERLWMKQCESKEDDEARGGTGSVSRGHGGFITVRPQLFDFQGLWETAPPAPRSPLKSLRIFLGR